MEDAQLIEAFESRAERRNDRRDFFRTAIAAATIGAGALAFADRAEAQTLADTDVLNFALNLEYLEAQFFAYATTGAGIDSTQLTGTGTQGTVTGGQKVTFADPVLSAFAQEIAKEDLLQVKFLRGQLTTTNAVAMPSIDIGGTDPNGAFSKLAQAAGLVGAGTAFNPYASDDNFLLAAFMLKDVVVAAYKGMVPLLFNRTYVEATAGILAVESYHASTIRTALYARGATTPSLRTNADAISNARDNLDGATDDDQGISPVTINGGAASNITPADGNGLIFGRSTTETLNVLYLNSASVSTGGFFPAGTNGTVKTSAAN